MKTIKYIVSLAAVCMLAMSVSARTFEQGEKIYVNADQSFHSGDGGFNWANDEAKLSLWVWKDGVSNNGEWVELSVETGALYSGDMPAGDFNRCIIVRGSKAFWWDKPEKWNQTGNIEIPDAADRNYISKFWDGNKDADWLTYSLPLDKIKSLASDETEELMKICPNALGYSYTLHPRLNVDKSDYDYGNVACHSWYVSTDKETWTSVDGFAGLHDGEQHKDTFYIIPETLPSNVIYFYLYSSKKAGRRLLKITPTATDCDYDCEITSFEVACSAVNANDTTYTLDGMVAFGVPCGDLIIECDGHSTRIPAAEAKSPQIFSIKGLRAVTEKEKGKTLKATAKFEGNPTGAVESKPFTIPDATRGIMRTSIDVLVGQSATLNPQGADFSNIHSWYVDGVEKTDVPTDKPLTTEPFNKADTTKYTYKEFQTPPPSSGNMIENGDYETDPTEVENVYGNKGDMPSKISDYRFWGQYPQTDNTYINFYKNTDSKINPEGWTSDGYALVKNANNFYSTFAVVEAREGDFYALFDAAVSQGEGEFKKAWKADGLKIEEGTTYLFSFWAANINNYGEMDNAAILQFQIEYNGNKIDLGDPLNLGSDVFRNNRWHQRSATFTADDDAEGVTISVVNKNSSRFKVGNDFALDDIQFRAVSSPSHSVKRQEVFTVITHEPKIESVSAKNLNMPCGESEYDIEVTVGYKNPKGKLVIKDVKTGKEYPQNVPAVGNDWEVLKKPTFTIHIDALTANQQHQFMAVFPDYPDAQYKDNNVLDEPKYRECAGIISLTADTLPMPCGESSFEVKFVVEYVNPDGDLMIDDNGNNIVQRKLPTSSDPNATLQFDTTILVTSLTPTKHVYHAYLQGHSDAGEKDSIESPKFVTCPVIALNAEAIDKGCDSTAYDVKLTATYVNPDGNLIIEDVTDGYVGNIVFNAAVPFTLNNTEQKDTTIRIAELKDHKFVAYYAGKDTTDVVSVSAPTFVKCPEVITLDAEVIDKGCNSSAYDVKLTVEYVNIEGNLIIEDVKDGYVGNIVFNETVPFKFNDTLSVETTIRIDEFEDHQFIAYYAGKDSSDIVSVLAPTFVKCPEVIKVSNTVFEKGCDSIAYDVELKVDYVNPDDQLVVEDAAGNVLYQEDVDAGTLNETQNVVISLRMTKFENGTLLVYIKGHKDGGKNTNYIAPEFVRCCTNPNGLIYHKWGNVLFVNNNIPDTVFVSYQWYKNNVKMEGDTLQRLYSGPDPEKKMENTSDLYHCVMVTSKGDTIETCPKTFNEFWSSAKASQNMDQASVSVRPTRVAAGAAVTVSKTTEEAMTATLRTMTGQLISTTQFNDSESTMAMPNNAGVYLLQLQGKETNTTVKIHVY